HLPSSPNANGAKTSISSLWDTGTKNQEEPDPLEDMTDDRKANLFQFLLRDLEVEEVPLLGVDATETHIFQAALWTTMAELSESDLEDKVCLVFESIPVPTLKTFVEAFDGWKSNSKMMESVPELKRFNVTLVGKGVGPAMVVSTSNRTDSEASAYDSMKQSAPVPDEIRWNAAMKTFVARTSSSNFDTAVYRIVRSTDACDIMSGYWTSICELLSVPEDQMSPVVLTYPPVKEGLEKEQHDRFAAIAQLMGHLLSMCSDSKEVVSNLYIQPFYDRDESGDNASDGHLAPSSSDSGKSDEALRLENYVRRSPLPGVIIQRAGGSDQYKAAESLSSQTEEELKEALNKELDIIALSTPEFQ
ncbi:MAG: hypothetical protein SGILL_000574, partial [Bacillariaceae sp.]